jgi:hypothetical protein
VFLYTGGACRRAPTCVCRRPIRGRPKTPLRVYYTGTPFCRHFAPPDLHGPAAWNWPTWPTFRGKNSIRESGVVRSKCGRYLAPRARFELATLRLTAERIKNLSALSGVAYEKLGAIFPFLVAPTPAPTPATPECRATGAHCGLLR